MCQIGHMAVYVVTIGSPRGILNKKISDAKRVVLALMIMVSSLCSSILQSLQSLYRGGCFVIWVQMRKKLGP